MVKKCIGFFVLVSLALTAWPGESHAQQAGFYCTYWADPADQVNNTKRWRVNDPDLSLHPKYGTRNSATANGLLLIKVPDDLFTVLDARLYMELWGGHPGTFGKQALLNGKGVYAVPDVGSASHHCTYHYPVIPLTIAHLVTGYNAFLFTCDRPGTAWGHYIIDEAHLRIGLAPEHPALMAAGLSEFEVAVQTIDGGKPNEMHFQLACPPQFAQAVKSVTYFGRYADYDENGDGVGDGWHGYTRRREVQHHVGSTHVPSFQVQWDTDMIPTQNRPMAVRAEIELADSLWYQTPVLEGLRFPENRARVELFPCSNLPSPFWARKERTVTGIVTLPDNLDRLDAAALWIRIWKTQTSEAGSRFTVNGYPYRVMRDDVPHNLQVYRIPVPPEHLRPGNNEISVFCDSEHHGVEVLLPGPSLVVRWKP